MEPVIRCLGRLRNASRVENVYIQSRYIDTFTFLSPLLEGTDISDGSVNDICRSSSKNSTYSVFRGKIEWQDFPASETI